MLVTQLLLVCTESLNANDGSTSAIVSVDSRCKAHTCIKDIRGKVQFLLLSSDSRPAGPENQEMRITSDMQVSAT